VHSDRMSVEGRVKPILILAWPAERYWVGRLSDSAKMLPFVGDGELDKDFKQFGRVGGFIGDFQMHVIHPIGGLETICSWSLLDFLARSSIGPIRTAARSGKASILLLAFMLCICF